MAKVKAKIAFSGVVTMSVREIRDIPNSEIVKDLVSAGYVEEIKDAPVKDAPVKKRKGDE